MRLHGATMTDCSALVSPVRAANNPLGLGFTALAVFALASKEPLLQVADFGLCKFQLGAQFCLCLCSLRFEIAYPTQPWLWAGVLQPLTSADRHDRRLSGCLVQSQSKAVRCPNQNSVLGIFSERQIGQFLDQGFVNL